ncbi:hypothetical protein BKA61DRAFT_31796 [Leptodontidium sp. MPI-SDFR-AT-0119]|nr:hypothetical protein BKA61DRAFT_31796 [Leptodontidium sp. MPI-SDFR-AT-0119]
MVRERERQLVVLMVLMVSAFALSHATELCKTRLRIPSSACLASGAGRIPGGRMKAVSPHHFSVFPARLPSVTSVPRCFVYKVVFEFISLIINYLEDFSLGHTNTNPECRCQESISRSGADLPIICYPADHPMDVDVRLKVGWDSVLYVPRN